MRKNSHLGETLVVTQDTVYAAPGRNDLGRSRSISRVSKVSSDLEGLGRSRAVSSGLERSRATPQRWRRRRRSGGLSRGGSKVDGRRVVVAAVVLAAEIGVRRRRRCRPRPVARVLVEASDQLGIELDGLLDARLLHRETDRVLLQLLMVGLQERMKGPRYDVFGPWPVCPRHIAAQF